ncbi:Uncharacterised protein [Mycobacterium tuberculosis]|nr:Uncharacterised protein [Mycobacterium tuberculosis]
MRPPSASSANPSTNTPDSSRWICSDAKRFTDFEGSVASVGDSSSKVTEPRPFGSCAVSPGDSSIDSTSVLRPVSLVMSDVSRT